MADPESFDWSIHDEIDQAVQAAEQERAQAPSANLPFFDECVDMTAPDEVEGEMPDIARYLERAHAARDLSWQDVRGFSAEVVHDNAVLARWLLRSIDNPGAITNKVIEGLSVILKSFAHFLQLQSVTSAIISGMTAIDLFAASLSRGIDRYAAGNPQLLAGLQIAAVWARVAVVGMKFTAAVIKAIMVRMMQVIKPLMNEALAMVGAGNPMPLVIAGATAVAGHVIA
jgi:hypothetical protein